MSWFRRKIEYPSEYWCEIDVWRESVRRLFDLFDSQNVPNSRFDELSEYQFDLCEEEIEVGVIKNDSGDPIIRLCARRCGDRCIVRGVRIATGETAPGIRMMLFIYAGFRCADHPPPSARLIIQFRFETPSAEMLDVLFQHCMTGFYDEKEVTVNPSVIPGITWNYWTYLWADIQRVENIGWRLNISHVPGGWRRVDWRKWQTSKARNALVEALRPLGVEEVPIFCD